jgi:hypothetical protein
MSPQDIAFAEKLVAELAFRAWREEFEAGRRPTVR